MTQAVRPPERLEITFTWMERVLHAGKVLDDDAVDTVDVDKISFTSQASSNDSDLHMSVQQSPALPRFSDQKCSSEVSLHCLHRTDSGADTRNIADPCPLVVDQLYKTSRSSGALATSELEPASLVTPLRSPSSLIASEYDDHWINEFSVKYSPDHLPEVVPQEPYWKKIEEELSALLQRDASISVDLEESNCLMYALELSLCAMEESRWLNEISKDPELSRLVHEIDPKFPLAVNRLYGAPSNEGPPTDESEKCSGSQLDSSLPCFDLADAANTKSTFFANKKRVARRSWLGKGADVDRSSRSPEHVWKKTILPILESFIEKEHIRDPRVAHWIEDMVQNHDKLMLFQGTSHESSKGNNFDGNLTRLSGNSEWCPLRETWIFTLWKSESVKVLLEAQNYRCSGCGIRLEKEYIKRVKYCEYYGKVFCQCCHQGSKSTIPARILHTWNFNEYPVSDIASHFLHEVHDVPAIHILHVAPRIVEKVRVLKHVIMLREKLSYMWDFVKDCPDAEETVTKYGNLRTLFTSLEHHLLHSLDLFSLSDLIRVHNKDMTSLLEPIVYYARCHIEACEHCKQFAATCAYCEDTQEVLFPFQLEKVYKCGKCASLSHLKCQAKFRRKALYEDGCKKCLKVLKDK
ncbi:hypothetical protein KIN20_009562 [Parelaphostrongylus tenuis]|uniref:Rubicon Homology domain-containing protein n=1 Tax=Parelaphostrongylus tenuis TaxID=148309 RepID=A0AAD5QJP8_PARTN|nr:hypothetical protein KIN20_009562 [Parelaphostrongylus tenuis]